ncbi:glycogen debranching N-terminal domain-containing protein [Bifidobacterium oedipodis]|uniref:Amylo-alpha-1,6-glucosidase n=1 Tax=Bifidobacterium oedipodis TaxID=2675322 RepID=A0A7Y0ES16_9BIFI|nr:glycogen debranching N-terminal domain-containing protein [Bifidobacterium sp. DSM 109957]NMM94933.1 amylo-alpha-1,6-glucosidase [Bifidobacterium sp. DSM 109957]
MTTYNERQPWMQDLIPLIAAPAQLWCTSDGCVGDIDGVAIRSGAVGIDGLYVGDTRVLSSIQWMVDDETPTPISFRAISHDASVGTLIARGIDGATVDPAVRLDEHRHLTPAGLTERMVVRSSLDHDIDITLRATVRMDMATMQEVKGGAKSSAVSNGTVTIAQEASDRVHVVCGPVTADIDMSDVDMSDGAMDTPADAGTALSMKAQPALSIDGMVCEMRWPLHVAARGSATAAFTIAVASSNQPVIDARTTCPWQDVRVSAADSRVSRWVNASLGDLAGLRMSVPALPDDEFLAAGAPWFFTLFGRDSLWAARFMLPLTTVTAMGTLRTLAHFQATASDPETNADPGKIPHELRGEAVVSEGAFASDGMSLPPLYYGTIDATPLWIILLGEAWRWGAPEDQVRELLPNLEAALAWLRDWGDCDGDGFLEYIDRSGHGLSNQGWKDSGDSVRWHDGSIAEGPIALCEVQGYAYQAALAGADLLDHFGRDGGDAWREWAAQLKARFNKAFWVDDGNGRYPAIALDARKRPVDSLTSNIGHLLGTGILDERGVADVVTRLMGDDMMSGYGVRTMSADCGGYWPHSYHCGSVWAHDSAIAMCGLRDEGYVTEAVRVAEGLIRAADAFDYQIPELYSGDSSDCGGPSPYPAACHPQAWSAASSVAVLSVLLGLTPDGSTPVDSPLAQDLRLERGE